jgi:hypothetical protein
MDCRRDLLRDSCREHLGKGYLHLYIRHAPGQEWVSFSA